MNIPRGSLPFAFSEMHRALQPGGLLLLGFHVGTETLRPAELWGKQVSMDWFFFSSAEIEQLLEAAGFIIKEVKVREPYSPDVEHQSRRAYILDRRPKTSVLRCGCSSPYCFSGFRRVVPSVPCVQFFSKKFFPGCSIAH